MSIFSVVEDAMESITDLGDDCYELPEQSNEGEDEQWTRPGSVDYYDSSPAHEEEGMSHPPVQEDHVIDTVRSFVRYIHYSHSLLLRSAGSTSESICPNELNSATIKMRLRGIMGQCRRLRDEPQMFPSAMAKDKFLATVTKLSGVMTTIEQMRAKILDSKQQVYSPITGIHQQSSSLQSPTPVVYQLPAFLPDKLHGKHPWNNWLDNSAQSVTGWVAVQQKIPKAGEKLMRKWVLYYDVVQHQFDEEADPVVSPKNNEEVEEISEIPLPGDSFRHMTWSGFCTFPSYKLGFKSGGRREFDFDGIQTLEYYSKRLCMLYGGAGMELGSDNCPYFRFAMAYRKL